MPITPETDIFGGIEDNNKGLSIRWHYATDESEEGYLELIDTFRTQAYEMSEGNKPLPSEMVKAEIALDELGQ